MPLRKLDKGVCCCPLKNVAITFAVIDFIGTALLMYFCALQFQHVKNEDMKTVYAVVGGLLILPMVLAIAHLVGLVQEYNSVLRVWIVIQTAALIIFAFVSILLIVSQIVGGFLCPAVVQVVTATICEIVGYFRILLVHTVSCDILDKKINKLNRHIIAGENQVI